MDDGSQRTRAPRWVIGLGCCSAGLLVLAAALALLGAFLGDSPRVFVLALVSAGWAAAWVAAVRAFAAHRPGGWQGLAALIAAEWTWTALGWATGRPVWAASTIWPAVDAVQLVLLLHRTSRAWVGRAGVGRAGVGRAGVGAVDRVDGPDGARG